MSKATRVTDQNEQKLTTRRAAARAAGPAPAAAHLQRLPERPEAATPSDVTQLQARYGNRAVQHMLSGRTVQAKLAVGPANDQYEQEADRVAQQVMRMPAAQEDEEEKPGV